MESEKPTVPVEKLVRVYLKMRNAKNEIAAEYDKKLEEIDAQIEQVKRALLDYCKEQNLESVRTESGLFYRTIKRRYWTNNWEAMGQFVLEHKIPEVYEKRLHQGNIQAWIEQNPDKLPPGLNIDSEYQITVRKK
jgi:hypothetical protein